MAQHKYELILRLFGLLAIPLGLAIIATQVLQAEPHPQIMMLGAALMGWPSVARASAPRVLTAVDEAQARIDAKTRVWVAADDQVADWDAFAEEIEPDLRKLIESGG